MTIKLLNIPEIAEKEKDKNFASVEFEKSRIKTIEQNPIRNLDLIQNTHSCNSAFAFSEIHNMNSINFQQRNNTYYIPLKSEIDNLDIEIKQLQDKLNIMINEKNTI